MSAQLREIITEKEETIESLKRVEEYRRLLNCARLQLAEPSLDKETRDELEEAIREHEEMLAEALKDHQEDGLTLEELQETLRECQEEYNQELRDLVARAQEIITFRMGAFRDAIAQQALISKETDLAKWEALEEQIQSHLQCLEAEQFELQYCEKRLDTELQ